MVYCGGCGVKLSQDNITKKNSSHLENIQTIEQSFANAIGEYKQVTLMYADIRGSLDLIRDAEPEMVEGLIDTPLKQMITLAQNYGGSVVQVQGDGVLAVFGAPSSLEDHALRACDCALSLLSVFKNTRYKNKNLTIGIGLSSGRVVISPIQTSLGVEYRLLGTTAWLSSRLEKLAEPGTAIISDSTYEATVGLFLTSQKIAANIKGAGEVSVYQLLGRTPLTRFQSSMTRGVSPFVGRSDIFNTLVQQIEAWDFSSTLTQTLYGAPGVGKSRLAYELIEQVKKQFVVLEISGNACSQSPYFSLAQLLRRILNISHEETIHSIQKKLFYYLSAYPNLKKNQYAFIHLLNIVDDNKKWERLDPVQKQQYVFSAIRKLLGELTQTKKLLLLIEDMQWVDSETRIFINTLQEDTINPGVMLLVTTRDSINLTQAVFLKSVLYKIDVLDRANAQKMIDNLVGNSTELSQYREDIANLSQFNPFYIEETIRSRVQAGELSGEKGNYQIGKVKENINVPSTIESIIMARFDRLSAPLKLILRISSALKDNISSEIIGEVIGSHNNLFDDLQSLVDLELLYISKDISGGCYQFCHALIGEVIYNNIHSQKQKKIHESVVIAIENLYKDNIYEHVDMLAQHARKSELWFKSLSYYKMACKQAINQSANGHASKSLEHALSCVSRLQKDENSIRERIDLCLLGLRVILPLGDHQRIRDLLRQAKQLAESINDRPQLGNLYSQLSTSMWIFSRHDEALNYANKAKVIAEESQNFSLSLSANHNIAMTHYAKGNFSEAIAIYYGILEKLVPPYSHSRLGWVGYPSVICRTFLGACLTAIGRYADATDVFSTGCELADKLDDPYSRAILREEYALCLLEQGQTSDALTILYQAKEICDKYAVANVYPSVCARLILALAHAGQYKKAVKLAEQAKKNNSHYIGGSFVNTLLLNAYGYALMNSGHSSQAKLIFNKLIKQTEAKGELPNYAFSLFYLGQLFFESNHFDNAQLLFLKADFIAKKINMLPLHAHCQCYIGRTLQSLLGNDSTKARKYFISAHVIFKKLELNFLIKRTDKYIKQLAEDIS